MSTPLFLGTDIGTQGTKTVLTDAAGQVLGSAFVPSALLRGADGSVTEDPAAIFDSVIRSVREAVENAGLTRPAVVDERQHRLYRRRRPGPPASGDEGLHVRLREQAAFPVPVAPAGQHAPAHVRVHGRRLDPEPPGHLFGAEQSFLFPSHVLMLSC